MATIGQLLEDDAFSKLAGSSSTLNKMMGMENIVSLVLDEWTETKGLEVATLTLASFAGSAPLKMEIGSQQVGFDPNRGETFIELLPPAGGWYFEATAAPATDQNVTGFIVTAMNGTDLYWMDHLSIPVVINRVGAAISLPPIRLYVSDF